MSRIDTGSIFDFQHERGRALRDALESFFQGRRNTPLPFAEIKKYLGSAPEAYQGVKAVPVERIVGSENRYRDFSRRFAPKSKRTRFRWMLIDSAYRGFENLPPVVLYEAGGLYFVRDGNHRVSVAKSRGVAFIDAEIFSLNTQARFEPDMELKDMRRVILEQERSDFMRASGLGLDPPGPDLRFTEIAMYDALTVEIEKYRRFLAEGASGGPPDFQAAAAAWRRDQYLPFIREVESRGLLRGLPGRTPADLYAWAVRRAGGREAELAGCETAEDSAAGFVRERPARRSFLGLFGKRANR